MTRLAAKSLPYQSQPTTLNNALALFRVGVLISGNLASGYSHMTFASAAPANEPVAPVGFREVGSVTAIVTLNDVQKLNQAYVFYDYQEVKDVLSLHPGLVGILLNALPQIKRFFGKDTSVSLRVSCDQESDPTLSANIQTAMSVNEARAARKAFNASWWMRQPNTDDLPLTFNLEYV